MKDVTPGVSIEARVVPHPTSVSPEAQAVFRRLVGDDGVPLNSLHVMPDAGDHARWREIQAGADEQYAAAVKALASELRSSIETVTLGQATVHIATPEATARPDCAIIDLHGGAMIVGGGEACRAGARMQADQYGVRCYGVDYRMPPSHPYPAALDDCLTTYRHVLERHQPDKIVIAGRSSGGNLAVAMLLRARHEGLPLPAGLVLLSPEVDLTESGDSFQTNRLLDVVLPGSLMQNNLLYANGHDLSHPYLSPLFGDLTGFPPAFLQSGTRDLFLSNTVRLHRTLRAADVEAALHVFEAMPHGGFMGAAPEDRDLKREMMRFVDKIWT